jgi:predicted cupin superfamily sugar epimerase
MHPRASTLVEQLGLEPHPEGGYFREIHRSSAIVRPGDDRSVRAAVTSIYFLLAAGQHSRWHRVRSDEIWHFYEGDPLEILVSAPSLQHVERLIVSSVTGAGRLVQVVPPGWWQAARPQGAYSLVGCTVAPGFEFGDFNFLRDAPGALRALETLNREFAALA